MVLRLIHEIIIFYWLIRTCFRLVLGRWFVFRDVPLWVLRWFDANLGELRRDTDPDVVAWIEQLTQELRLRERQR